jgi:antitoxin component YwqK of YwqJK toxin-antitoxin module
LHYRGEYQDDKIVGDWITYNEKGKVTSEQHYPYIKDSTATK